MQRLAPSFGARVVRAAVDSNCLWIRYFGSKSVMTAVRLAVTKCIRVRSHKSETSSGGNHAQPSVIVCRHWSHRNACNARAAGKSRRHGLAAAAGQVHHSARARLRRRYHRAAVRGQAVGEMGSAGGGREPAGRRCHRGDQCGDRREGRSCAAVRPHLDLHRASLSARQAALRHQGSGADRARHQHLDRRRRADVAGRQYGEGTGREDKSRARQAELCLGHRRQRSAVRQLPEDRKSRDGEGAV